MDFVGSKSTLDFSLKSLGKQGAYIAVGLGGGALGSLTTTGMIRTELTLTGSRWGSYSELQEVYQLYKTNALKVLSQKRKLEEVNEVVEEMKRGVIEGRAVLMP